MNFAGSKRYSLAHKYATLHETTTNPVPSVVQLQNSHHGSLDSVLGQSMWDL
jgi:hypothetical protein